MAFRFRAGEEDLEELPVSGPSPADPKQFEALHKMFQQIPKKLLSKDPSMSDSEDTSESSNKLSEWWKEAEEIRNHRSGSSVSLQEATDSPKKRTESHHNIKIAKGRVEISQQADDVEPAEEVSEDLTPADTPTSQPISPIGSVPPHTSQSPTPSASFSQLTPSFSYPDDQSRSSAEKARLSAQLRASLSWLVGWCVTILAVFLAMDSSFFRGLVLGFCTSAIFKEIWKICIEVWFPPCMELLHGALPLPAYKIITPLRALAEPAHKRGCFNVYNKPYDPGTYSVSQTRSVCLEIKGHMLRVTRVKTRLAKRAHFTETDFQIDNSRYAYYDLSKCSVMLLPHGLTRKRLFSKKYPITVLLGEGAVVLAKVDEQFHAGAEGNGHATAADSEDETGSHRGSEFDSEAVPVTPALYFFARCDRDKEDWYRRLVKASTPSDSVSETLTNQLNKSVSSDVEEPPNVPVLSPLEDYLLLMSKFIDVPDGLLFKKSLEGEAEMEMDMDSLDLQWLNVVINRLLFDVCRSPYWTQTIQAKLQRKLSSLQLPYYVEEMQISELDLGRTGPVVHSVSRPHLDERGVWLDLALTHHGTIRLTICTKLNLHKLQKGREEDSLDISAEDKMRSRLYDSDAEDSAESSSDEDSRSDSPPMSNELDTPTKSKKKAKFLRIVENVAQSRAFRHVANTKMGQNIIAGVSNTDLKLKLEVKGIQGILAVNIPPPPSDRVWYGFRGMPKLDLTATPQFGSVSSSLVKNWIEKKLIQEFQFRCVLPQMGKILLPRTPEPDSPSASVASPGPLSQADYPSLTSLLQAELEARTIRKELDQQSSETNKKTYRETDFDDNRTVPSTSLSTAEVDTNSNPDMALMVEEVYRKLDADENLTGRSADQEEELCSSQGSEAKNCPVTDLEVPFEVGTDTSGRKSSSGKDGFDIVMPDEERFCSSRGCEERNRPVTDLEVPLEVGTDTSGRKSSSGKDGFDIVMPDEERLSRESYTKKNSQEIEQESVCDCRECVGRNSAAESSSCFRKCSSGAGIYRLKEE